MAEAPGVLARFLQRRDQLRFLGASTEILIQHPTGRRHQQLLHATIGYVGLPKPGKNGEAFVRADLPDCKEGPKALFLSGGALRRYFYLLDGDEPQSLYRLLRVPHTATLDQLRFAWRMRSLELQVSDSKARDLPYVERAFNVLAHADLRNCYDALCKNEDAAPLFPYGGFGSILVDVGWPHPLVSGLRALPWLYRARDDSEHRVRKNFSSDREHAKARRITLLELPLEVFEFVQQLPPSDGHEKNVRLESDLRSVETVSSPIRFLVNTPKISRNPGSRPLDLPEAL